MRYAIVTEAWEPQVNGVVRTYQNIIRELEKAGHEVQVISPQDFRINLPLPGYKEIRFALPLPGEVGKKLKAFNPDHIHIATEGPLGWAAKSYCQKNDLKFTTAYHTNFAEYLEKRLPGPGFLKKAFHDAANVMIRRFHNASHALMSVSDDIDRQMLDLGVTTPAKRLTRGVDTDIFHPGPKTLFTDQPLPVALYVGRVSIEKNIKAFLDMDIPYHKVVVGDGPQLEELRQAYPGVHFAGLKEKEELAEHYRSADVFVFPSKTDTFGIVLIEAMACGLPIAAYDDGGHTVIISDNRFGATAPDLGAAFNKAVAGPGTPAERFQHVQDHYSWAEAARQFTQNAL
ncbi:MAG: glycosyltransferase family 1 protein [Rhodospirillales bacterium]|nr:glycosyltransferase family 1 protein [Rhodospirillales bacterium]MCB9996862.1 glycosyltransferase family 1 protein [Rhodospirillales bacterium]